MEIIKIIEIISIVWIVGFIGGLGVLLKDYQSYGRDVLLPEFLEDAALTFIGWPCIVHWILWYSLKEILSLFRIDVSKLKNIKVIKGK